MMAGIGPKDTKPELAIRRALHARGLRFRLGSNYRRKGKLLFGKPDLVFPGRKAVIFVHGCFWHGHDCALFKWPAKGENTDEETKWRKKLTANILRDRKTLNQLIETGWRVLEVWECTLKGKRRMPFGEVITRCCAFLDGTEPFSSIGGSQTVTVEVSA